MRSHSDDTTVTWVCNIHSHISLKIHILSKTLINLVVLIKEQIFVKILNPFSSILQL